jgi:TetR/AcrR family transcriptional regulator
MARNYQSTKIRRKQIAAAAARIIVKYGSEHVTTKKIAKEVGISETAIYRHFKSKEELLSFLIEDIEVMLLSEIKMNDTASPYTIETLEKIIKAHMTHVVKRRGVSFQIIAEIISLGSKILNKQAYNVINKYIGRIRDILDEGSKAGVIRQDIDLDAAATLFFGMIQGLVNAWALSQYSFNLEEKYISTWNIFRNSILCK